MARDVVDELLTGYPTVFYFIVSVFCFHLAALVYWMYTMFSEPATATTQKRVPRKRYDDKGH